MPFIPYLSFQGQCAEAFAFYGTVFGATPLTSPYTEAPPDSDLPELPPEQRNWLMHAQLDTSDGMLMGADMPPQLGGVAQAGVSLAVSRADEATARALFETLAQGGEVILPYGPTFYAKGFGMCTDRFGTSWMVSHGLKDS
ncbi:VOC family protein [Paracoccus lutimaris]|uniref:PhnB protein n=1 Tax=Paracoccus lutimaris TaxID=1490030 RepID=A0A368YN92_9RHOB|nr:VOC family protein [Paracoccus lutimaris]RCW81700.1 PhnB protein [Paracoccus lutimaris]